MYPKWVLRALLMVSPAVLCGSCHDEPEQTSSNEPSTYRTRDEGSNALPTADASFRLMNVDGPARYSAFQDVVVSGGGQCASVKSAVLVGGSNGTDEWRVDCSDTGIWSVWFSPGNIEARRPERS